MRLENAPTSPLPQTAQAPCVVLSKHARNRMNQRNISMSAIIAALQYGKKAHARGAVFYAIGKKEVDACRRRGIDIRAHLHVQVVCTPSGLVKTVYRSSNFRPLRGRK